MYSAPHTIMSQIAIKKRNFHVLRGEDDAPSSNDQRTSLVRKLNNYLRNMLPAANQLSVTVVNHEILTSGISPTTKSMEEILHDLKESHPKDYIDYMLPISKLRHAPETDYLQDWHIVEDSDSVKTKNDVNLIKNSSDIHDDNSTTESHSMLEVNETEKTTNIMIDASGILNADPRKCEADIHKDTDVESFLVVSHSDVPATPVDLVKENSMSRFSSVCRNAWWSTWNILTSRLPCKTGSARMSVKRPLYSTKQHYRRKANAIAMGRGRGRAKCQLRRSGVSQTIRRKECIKYGDYETLQNNLVGAAPSDRPLDSKLDSLNNINVIKQIDNPSISNFPRTTAKGKSKARKKKIKAKHVTKVRYIAKSSRMKDRDYCKDSNGEMSDAQDSSRSRTLSEHSAEIEDDWIVFEDDDDEKLPETREKRGATEYPIRARYVPNSSMRKRDSSYEDPNSKAHDSEEVSFRMRSSSESSTDSEDSDHSCTVLDEQKAMQCPRMHDSLMNIIDEHCEDIRMQKHLFQRCRLLSDSSETSNDSNSSEASDDSNISDTSNSSFVTEENDDVDGYEISFHDGDSIIFAAEDNEESTAQIKKVSFDPTPIVHVMVTWNYAYRAARRGPWEEIARDTERFRGRINSIAIVLDPILKSTHRSQIWQERFAFPIRTE